MAVTLDVAMKHKRPLSLFELFHENLIGIFHAIWFQFSTYDNAPHQTYIFNHKKIDENAFTITGPFLKSAADREIVIVENEWNMGQLHHHSQTITTRMGF